jgi:type IV secretory pathway VirB2 component (pilin)
VASRCRQGAGERQASEGQTHKETAKEVTVSFIKGWTGGQFFVFTLAVMLFIFVGLIVMAGTPPHWLRYAMWAVLIVWFAAAWIWFGRKRND